MNSLGQAMDLKALHRQLVEELKRDAQAFQEKRQLLALLEKRMRTQGIAPDSMRVSASTVGQPELMLEGGGVDLPPAVSRVGSGAGTLARAVRDVLPRLEKLETFVVGDVATAIEGSGYSLPEKPNPKITTVLARLCESGHLELVKKGSGSVPNQFRVAPTLTDDEL